MYVSLIGSDEARVRALGAEVERETMGRVVTEEEVVRKKQGVEMLARSAAEVSARSETEVMERREAETEAKREAGGSKTE